MTLENKAILPKNSYVDIRNVYKLDWKLLEKYTRPEAPDTEVIDSKRNPAPER